MMEYPKRVSLLSRCFHHTNLLHMAYFRVILQPPPDQPPLFNRLLALSSTLLEQIIGFSPDINSTPKNCGEKQKAKC